MVQVLAGRPVAGGGQRARARRGLDAVKLATEASEALEEKMATRRGLGADRHGAKRTGRGAMAAMRTGINAIER
jgi:hypothetical protein